MKKTRSYLFAALALVAVALVLGYFLILPHAEHVPAGPPEKITFAYSATMDSVLAAVAQMQGYYLQEGLEVTAHLHPFGKPALQEVLEGRADFATVAETPVMLAIMNGAKISIIATIQTANKVNAIVARKDKGILTPGDLKGRRIAVTLGTTADFFMDTFLALHEIARQEIKVVDLKPERMADALYRGEVDAVSVFVPFPIQVQKRLGSRAIAFYDDNIYTFMFNVVATQKFIRENPGKVRKLLRALVKAEEFVSRNESQAQMMVADFSRTDPALIREVWQSFSYRVKLDQSLLLALEEETRWAEKGKLVGRHATPDYLDYIYLEGLESIRPKSVRILR
jgi:sulfonate transport system substrate-binding protein